MRAYDGLIGSDFLDKLQATQPSLLEIPWRVGDEQVCALIASRMARSGETSLAGLLATEVLDQELGAGVAAASMAAVAEFFPPVLAPTSRQLAERLRTGDDLGPYEPYRNVLESWVISQRHKAGFEFALAVLRLDTSRSSDESVRRAALERVAASPAELSRACHEIADVIHDFPSEQQWQVGVEMATVANTSLEDGETHLNRLLGQVIHTAPSQCPTDAFSSELVAAITERATQELEAELGSSLPAVPGTLALVRTAELLNRRADRLRLFRVSIVRQGPIWRDNHASLVATWGKEEWPARLRELHAVREQVDSAVLELLIARAPSECSALVMKLVAYREAAIEQELQTAAEKVADNLRLVAEQGGPPDSNAALEAVWWPPRNRPAELERAKAVLWRQVDPARAAELIVAAQTSGRLDSKRAAALLASSGAVLAALRSLGRCDERQELVEALLTASKDEVLEAAHILQGESLCLDIAAAVAAIDSGSVFQKADGAYAGLNPADKEQLLGLLENWGGPDQANVLRDYIEDTRANVALRERATRKIGSVTEEGDAVPDCVVRLLASNRPNLRKAATSVIGEVRPRDEMCVKELRALADKGSVPGDLAQATLNALATDYAAELENCQDRARVILLLSLLGLTGSPAALLVLLGYLGEQAVDDHEDVRRAAAKAVGMVCDTKGLKLSTEELDGLVEVAEGEGREVDAEASDHLTQALARARLGDDAALGLLFAKAGYQPRCDPSRMFGDERADLLDHLSLYEKEVPRGEAGWPNLIVQLDLIAERLANAAYLALGPSEVLKEKIRNRSTGAYGNVIGAMKSVKGLGDAEPSLQVLHKMRSERTQVPHAGVAPSREDVTTADQVFRDAAKRILMILDESLGVD